MTRFTRKIRVLIVDDSAVVRRMIHDALAHDPQIEVVGSAPDPYVAREKILALDPDVLTLDLEMPRMDGLTFLRLLQRHRPMPVVIISSLTQTGSAAALEALRAGAVEVLAKPNSAYSIGHLKDSLARHIKAAAAARLQRPSPTQVSLATRAASAPVATVESSGTGAWHPRQIIAIGASTGGVQALSEVLTQLPADLPGMVIAQHIPPYFSRVFAERIHSMATLDVCEAAEGDWVRPGRVLVAPGDYHLTVRWSGNGYRVALNQNPPVHFCRPAVDVMFGSIAECPGARVVAAILTGMGTDGAVGMKALKAIGARTLAQDEASCVVYGMPRAACELGVVDRVLPLSHMARGLREAALEMAGAKPAPALTGRA